MASPGTHPRARGVDDAGNRAVSVGTSPAKYGLERTCRHPLCEGDIIHYRITNPDGQVFEFDKSHLAPATYERTMRDCGFADFGRIDASLDPAEPEAAFWDDFLAQKPLIGFTAKRS